ncbi:uncharacterized protein PV06_03329 [Exophiala oligosperma]|uniref:Uncharacterized protein n=1 Tax=Exophiala oligosperma TaxID=215243 RepID=A0A0D2C525_9EURO|nr:uncharacterized protein PV06_03329 [Exophiala oligosperma]KIW44892.1 hypothetical protein PV06_03329 [Exophiala oligosperma]
MSTVTSPTRRVLGEKDPNALLSPTKATKTSLVEGTTLSPRSLKRFASPISPRAGQKRKIVETCNNNEEAEDSQQQQTNNSQLFLSQHTDILSSDGPLSEHRDASQSPMAATQHKSMSNTTLTSCQASQEEESAQLESEFQIHDEPSQQTLDKMHAVSFTQSTSQMVALVRPTFNQEPSQASLSMSSLIDFENNFSSQSDEMQMLEEHDTTEPRAQPPKPEGDTRKEMLLEKAETLRTRLQLAIYKIQTNQISKPFWQLTVPKHAPSSPEIPAMSSSSPRAGSSSTLRPSSVHRHPVSAISPESRVAIARARATMKSKPPVRPLRSLAVPTIAPTAFSARWAEDMEGDSHSQPAEEDIPSSPPAASTSEAEDEDLDDEVRIKHEHRDPRSDDHSEQAPPKTPELLSRRSGTRTDHGHNNQNEEDVALQNSHLRPRGLTSSVIKGEAANSLLQLVRGGTRGATSSGVGMCGL